MIIRRVEDIRPSEIMLLGKMIFEPRVGANMRIYVALLRAVNVGGNRQTPRSDLKAMCADAGFLGARTYIAIEPAAVCLKIIEIFHRGFCALVAPSPC
jgi:hypothetical protein